MKKQYTEKEMEQRRAAVRRHESKVDRINCQLPLGTKDRIYSLTGKSANAFIKEAVLKELDKIERKQKREKNATQDQDPSSSTDDPVE